MPASKCRQHPSLLLLRTMHFHVIVVLSLTLVSPSLSVNCPCGWLLAEQNAVYTTQLYEDFSQYPDLPSVLDNPKAASFNRNWMIYDY